MSGADADADDTYHMPRWVKVVGIIGIVLVLLLVALLVFGGGQHGGGGHGPGRHLPQAEDDGSTTPHQGGDHESPGSDHGAASPVADGASRFNVTADAFAFAPSQIRVAAGAGETATGGFHAGRPGRYVYYCAEPGHREAGMEGILTVDAPQHHARG